MKPHLAVVLLLFGFSTTEIAKRPHIVWIVVEDMSCHFGYHSEHFAVATVRLTTRSTPASMLGS